MSPIKVQCIRPHHNDHPAHHQEAHTLRSEPTGSSRRADLNTENGLGWRLDNVTGHVRDTQNNTTTTRLQALKSRNLPRRHRVSTVRSHLRAKKAHHVANSVRERRGHPDECPATNNYRTQSQIRCGGHQYKPQSTKAWPKHHARCHELRRGHD